MKVPEADDEADETIGLAQEPQWQEEHRLWNKQFAFPDRDRQPREREEKERMSRVAQEQHRRLQRIRSENAGGRQGSPADQFALVLRQTEVFGLMLAGASPLPSGPDKPRLGRRGRSEKDGDEELLRECEDGAATVARLHGTPLFLRGELRPYQLEGVNFLIRLFDCGINGVLADEMGLGKTFQTIALLAYLKYQRGLGGPHLIVAPKSVLPNWMKEIRRWCPGLSALKFHGDKEERAALRETELFSGRYDCVLTTYEMVSKEKSALQRMQFRYIIVDEAHRLKNEASLLSVVLRHMHSSHRLLITGTPLQNNLHELWALLNYLLPHVFDDGESFDSWFSLKEGHAETSVVMQLHKLLKPFMLRRLKSDVERNLPPKKEIYVGCGLAKMQREWYTKILTRDAAVVNGNSASRVALLNIVMQLRKVCNHPYLFEGAEEGPPYITDEHIVQNSGKMCMLDKLLRRLQSQGSRVLLFCQMTRMLDILEDYLRFRGFEYCRLDGSTHSDEREEMVEDFNREGSTKFIFVLSTRAGGLGINLATANTVILYDSDWNPQIDLQAQDRAHRIGQKKPVTVFRFVSEGTIEEKVYQRAVKKLYLDAAVIQQGRLQEQNKALNKDDLLAMVRWGAEEMFSAKDSEITDEDIDRVLERGAEVVKTLEDTMKRNCQMNLLNFSLNIEDSNLYHFEGVDYSQTPTKSLYLSGLTVAVTEEAIRQVFEEFGELRRVVVSPERDKALVQYKRLEAAVLAFSSADRIGFPDCPEVRLAYGNKNMTIITGDMVAQVQSSQLPRRERTRLAILEPVRSPVPEFKAPKLPQYHDFQFFDVARLRHFQERERAFLQAQWERRHSGPRPGTSPVKDADHSDDEGVGEERWLTPAEAEEYQRLQGEGFPDWNRRDYQAFVRLSEKYGRHCVESIAAEMEGKTLDEVQRYTQAFWTLGPQALPDWDKVLKRIEKGEASLQRRTRITAILEWKTQQYLNPWTDLAVPYQYAAKSRPPAAPTAGAAGGVPGEEREREAAPARQFSEVEDRFLVCLTAAIGYGEWDRLKAELRRCWEFRFNYFITSRSVVDLSRRVDQLVKMVERERAESRPKRPPAAATAAPRIVRPKKRPAGREGAVSPAEDDGLAPAEAAAEAPPPKKQPRRLKVVSGVGDRVPGMVGAAEDADRTIANGRDLVMGEPDDDEEDDDVGIADVVGEMEEATRLGPDILYHSGDDAEEPQAPHQDPASGKADLVMADSESEPGAGSPTRAATEDTFGSPPASPFTAAALCGEAATLPLPRDPVPRLGCFSGGEDAPWRLSYRPGPEVAEAAPEPPPMVELPSDSPCGVAEAGGAEGDDAVGGRPPDLDEAGARPPSLREAAEETMPGPQTPDGGTETHRVT